MRRYRRVTRETHQHVIAGDLPVQMQEHAEYEQLSWRCVHLIGSYMPPDSLSRFRNIDLFHRRELKSALVDALAASTSVRATFALAEIAEKGDAGAIAAVSARLERADSDVRKAAVDALPKIAEKGDASAIAAVSARLEDADRDVRSAAVLALPKIAEKGDAGLIPILLDRWRRYSRQQNGSA